MLQVFASLVLFSLTRLSAAQFASFPVCVQPLLYRSFPAACLSYSLVAQNTCLCQNADAAGSAIVTAVFQACGCAALEQTSQLIAAYCAQVGIDTGPAFSVFIQDDTTCGAGTVSGGSATGMGASTPTGGSSSTGTAVAVSTPTGGITVTVAGGSTPTPTGGNTVTVTAGSTSTPAAGTKTSGANKRLVVGQIVNIFVGVTGGILALW